MLEYIQLYIHLFKHMCTSMGLCPCLLLVTVLVTLLMFSNMEYKYNFIWIYFNILCPLKFKITLYWQKCFKTIHLNRAVLRSHKIFNLLRDLRWWFYRILWLCVCFDEYYFSATFHWHNWDEANMSFSVKFWYYVSDYRKVFIFMVFDKRDIIIF